MPATVRSPSGDKPRLLFISPTTPALTGNGLAMRAGMMLEALAGDYSVYLLVIPVVGGSPVTDVHPRISDCCARITVHRVERVDPLFGLIARVKDPHERLAARLAYPRPSLCRFATGTAVREAAEVVSGTLFQAVHVFRLYMAPFAEPYLGAAPAHRPACRLDLDDVEPSTRQCLATLYEEAGDQASAALERAEAARYTEMERRYLPRFDQVYVCCDRDRRALGERYGEGRIVVIPNGVHLPAIREEEVARPAPFTLLFVGNLGHYPNEDAAAFLCSHVLPRLRAVARQPFRILIVGPGSSRRLRTAATHPEVTVTGWVPDLSAHYRDADAVVVPLRAGGGTRIKILEAFSYHRPVVSTGVGAEGLEVDHGRHLLVADTADGIAEHCARLMQTPALGRQLAERAFEFVTANHSAARIRELLRAAHSRSA